MEKLTEKQLEELASKIAYCEIPLTRGDLEYYGDKAQQEIDYRRHIYKTAFLDGWMHATETERLKGSIDLIMSSNFDELKEETLTPEDLGILDAHNINYEYVSTKSDDKGNYKVLLTEENLQKLIYFTQLDNGLIEDYNSDLNANELFRNIDEH